MKISPEINKILQLMAQHRRFLISSHRDPDGDSLGSQMGLYHTLKAAGKDVHVVNQGAIPEKYTFLDPLGSISFENKDLPFEPEVVFVLECPLLERIGFVRELIPSGAVIINIDHHLDNANYGHINLVDTESCAVGELIFFIIETGKYEISPPIADNLYAAIISDTGNFRFGSTTARGMRTAATLVDLGVNPKDIFDRIFGKASASTIRLLGYTLETLDTTSQGRIGFLTVTGDNVRKAQARIEDSEGFVDYSLSVSGVNMGILFKEIENDQIKVSVRTQNGVDAALFAKRYNGGGHLNAAGFTLSGQMADVVKRVVTEAGEYIDAN